MASVDGRRSFVASSDEVLQHTCGPCEDDGETKGAECLCEVCKVNLCFDCRDDHKKFKATKNHSIVSAHLTEGSSSADTRIAFAILCCCDQKRAVEVYCEKHDEVICSSCGAIKHRNCKTCPITDKDTKDAKKQLKEVVDKAKALKTEFEILKQDGEANRETRVSKKQECKKEITAFRQEINKILDKMEKEILETLDKCSNQQLQAIEKQIAALTASLQELDTDIDIIDNANKISRDDMIFSANVKLSKSISKCDEMVKDMRITMQLPKLKFQKNKKLIDMLTNEEGLGKINPSEAGSSQKDHVVILDMKVKSTTEINIKLPDDDVNPTICGCTFLLNGRILLCDYANKKVKLFDIDMSV